MPLMHYRLIEVNKVSGKPALVCNAVMVIWYTVGVGSWDWGGVEPKLAKSERLKHHVFLEWKT